jgi:hypothetical protein
MSDYGALIGGQLVVDELFFQGWARDQANAKEATARSLNDAAWRNQYNDLVNRYNALLADTNRLCKSYEAQIEAMDGSIDALRGSVNEIKTREARVIEERDRAQLRYNVLLALHKERDPGFKFFEE